MVDLTGRTGPGGKPRVQARLLEMVPGRSGPTYSDWCRARGAAFTAGVKIAALDTFRGCANAIDDELDDTVAVLDTFHVVRLALKPMEETRRRVQLEQFGDRSPKRDPLFKIQGAATRPACPLSRGG